MIRNIEWPVNGPLFRAQIGEEPVQAQYVGDTYKSIVVEYKGQEVRGGRFIRSGDALIHAAVQC